MICRLKAGSTFFNYKQEHSIVLLTLVNAHYKFIKRRFKTVTVAYTTNH